MAAGCAAQHALLIRRGLATATAQGLRARRRTCTRTRQDRLFVVSSSWMSSVLWMSSGRSQLSRSTLSTLPYAPNASKSAAASAKNGARTLRYWTMLPSPDRVTPMQTSRSISTWGAPRLSLRSSPRPPYTGFHGRFGRSFALSFSPALTSSPSTCTLSPIWKYLRPQRRARSPPGAPDREGGRGRR